MSRGCERLAAGADVLRGDGSGEHAMAVRLERLDDPPVERDVARGRR